MWIRFAYVFISIQCVNETAKNDNQRMDCCFGNGFQLFAILSAFRIFHFMIYSNDLCIRKVECDPNSYRWHRSCYGWQLIFEATNWMRQTNESIKKISAPAHAQSTQPLKYFRIYSDHIGCIGYSNAFRMWMQCKMIPCENGRASQIFYDLQWSVLFAYVHLAWLGLMVPAVWGLK